MIMEKLMSKRGQISMEIGILVAAAVAVAAVAAYFYIKSVKESAQNVGETASGAIGEMESGAQEYTNKIKGLFEENASSDTSTGT